VYSDPNKSSQREKPDSYAFDAHDSAYTEYAHPEYYQREWSTPATPQSGSQEQEDATATYAAPESYYPDQQYPAYSPDQQYSSAAASDQYSSPYQQPVSSDQLAAQQARQEAKPSSGLGKKLAGIGSGLVALGAWLLKFKFLLFFLKFGVAGFSALISIFFYSLIFGWPFAIGLVAILFLHEMGHALVMKLKGIPIGGLVFVPMLGAAVTMRRMPQSAKDEAEIGIAGPLAGAIVASLCLWFAYQDPVSIWAPLAYFGFFINLFNLIPVVPFDGGRVLAAVDRRAWIVGFVVLLGYQIWQWMQGSFNSFLLIFVIIAATQLWTRARSTTPNMQSYYDVPLATRISLTVAYFGLAAILVLGMTMSQGLLPGTGV
jgi:Zn-dependent proteases